MLVCVWRIRRRALSANRAPSCPTSSRTVHWSSCCSLVWFRGSKAAPTAPSHTMQLERILLCLYFWRHCCCQHCSLGCCCCCCRWMVIIDEAMPPVPGSIVSWANLHCRRRALWPGKRMETFLSMSEFHSSFNMASQCNTGLHFSGILPIEKSCEFITWKEPPKSKAYGRDLGHNSQKPNVRSSRKPPRCTM